MEKIEGLESSNLVDGEELVCDNDAVSAQTEENIRIHEIVPKEQLIKILECPVCREIPFPPILTCEQGHIVCSACRPKLSRCGVCRGHFRDARNYPLEDIILGSSFPCKYKDLGCKNVIAGRTFSNHLQICQYKPFFVLCNENRGTRCKNALIPSHGYLEHLKGQHNCSTGGQRNECTYHFIQVDDSAQMGRMTHTDYFEQNGEAFVQKWQFEDNLYYTWVCKLNSTPKSLENLDVMISVFCATSTNGPCFTISVMDVHDATLSLTDVKASGQFLALHPSQLLAFGGTGEIMIEDRIWDLHWKSVVRICQRTSNTDANE